MVVADEGRASEMLPLDVVVVVVVET